MEWCDWQGAYSALLKVPLCLGVGNGFLLRSSISGMDEFYDWKRPSPIPGHIIFPLSSSCRAGPFQCSCCEDQVPKVGPGTSLQ